MGYVNYSNKGWLHNTFSWWGTALPRCFLRIVIATTFCAFCELVVWAEFWEWTTGLRMQIIGAKLDPFGHTVLGSLIGFLLVVRMNGSLARYWEGRSHWGVIVNCSRNLARIANAYTNSSRELAGLLASYAISLRQSLRGLRDLSEAERFLPESLRQVADRFGNQPTAIAAAMSHWIARQAREGQLNSALTRHAEALVAEIVSAQGGCEKIQKTPLPFAYVSLTKLLITVYLATLPLVLCTRFGWWSPLIMAVLSLGMFGMEEASVEIEDPFGEQPNCIDLEVLGITIMRDTGQLSGFGEMLEAEQAPIRT